MSEAVRAELAVVVRQHAGRLAASLVQLTGDCGVLGDLDDARVADRRALELTANPAERAVLEQRIACTY